MKRTLFLFILFAAFALLVTVSSIAEATLDLDAETSQASLEEETVSLAPNAVVLEVRAVTVSNVLKWPHEELNSWAALDVPSLIGAENSTAEGRTERTGILFGGGSRL